MSSEAKKKGAFMDKLQEKLGPIADKMSENPYLNSISSGIGIMIPLIFVGSIACLLMSLNIESFTAFLDSTGIGNILNIIQQFTMNLIAIYATAGIAYRMSTHLKIDPLSSVLISVACLLIINPSEGGTVISLTYLGGQGLFMAILIGLLVPKAIRFFEDRNITIKMPKGVPPFVENSFKVLISTCIIILFFAVVTFVFAKTSFGSLPGFVYTILQVPFRNITGTFIGVMVIHLACDLLFFCGIHGNALMSIIMPTYIMNGVANMEAVANGDPIPFIFTTSFMTLFLVGGSGSTLGLSMDMLFFSKSQRYKKLSRVTIVPQICNINEPVLYGYPNVLNVTMLIPFLLTTVVNLSISYTLTILNVIPRLNGLMLGSGIPGFIKVILSGGGVAGLILWVALIVLDAAIYYPFFRVSDRNAYQIESKENTEE